MNGNERKTNEISACFLHFVPFTTPTLTPPVWPFPLSQRWKCSVRSFFVAFNSRVPFLSLVIKWNKDHSLPYPWSWAKNERLALERRKRIVVLFFLFHFNEKGTTFLSFIFHSFHSLLIELKWKEKNHNSLLSSLLIQLKYNGTEWKRDFNWIRRKRKEHEILLCFLFN